MRTVDDVVTFVRNDRSRRLTYAVLAVVSGILIFFPRPYVAEAKIVPQDTSATAASTTSLIGALGGSTQTLNSLLTGGKATNDLYLIIGRSDSVADEVIRRAGLVGPNGQFSTARRARLFLDKRVDVHLLLGGVMEIETKLYDPDEAKRITDAYANAISNQLASFGRQLIESKRRIVARRFSNATARVGNAEARLAEFRRANNLAEPEQQLGAALSQRANLQAQLQAKQVELQTLSEFRGPESNELAAVRSDIAAIRGQIDRTAVPTTGAAGPNVAGLSTIDLRYLSLYRDLRFQQAIYDVYQRSAEQVEVEELAAESASYIQTIDPAHIVATRQYNIWAIALFAGIVLLAFFTEWYAPVTGLFRLSSTKVENAPGAALAHD
jgi:hypothetical protein